MSLYASPRDVTTPDDCVFYHTIDLPQLGTMTGSWDLRGHEKEYLGNVDLKGKRVLELGTASGYLCFAMERMGAEVVAFEIAPDIESDIVPFARADRPQRVRDMQPWLEKIRNGYWLSHKALNSRAKVVYGTVYDVPLEIGAVDVAIFGAILLHLRDPFLALQNALQLVDETVIVTEPVWTRTNYWRYRLPSRLARPTMKFVPVAELSVPATTWWHISPQAIEKMIAVLGFEVSTVTYHYQNFSDISDPVQYFTLVGKRTIPRQIESTT